MTPDVDSMNIQFDPGALLILKFILGFIMFGVALDITPKDLKNIFKNPKALSCGLLAQFIFLPALTYVIVLVFEPLPSIALGMMLVAACPGGNISNLFTMLAKGNTALSVSMTFLSTVLAMVMTPFNVSFWASMYGPTNKLVSQVALNPMEVMTTVIFVLGVPLVLGLFLRAKNEKLAVKIQLGIKKISVLFLVALVVGAFFKNMDNFKTYIHHVIFIVLIHNFIAFFTGFSLASILGLDKRDKKAITIEVGIQNSGLGIALAFEFFGGLGGVSLVCAWWGVWHAIAGSAVVYSFTKNKTFQRVLRLN
jgi:BASS family bile acid:Na+ symporter